MIIAIYARKSTDQSGVADEQKSVARQIEHARQFAASKGWTVADEHVYTDDGISGAEFDRRPGFLRLMNALRPRAPFDVLIVSELSRLGREQLETGYAVKQLSVAGVTIWSYLEGKEVQITSPTDKFLMSAVNFAAEIEREKARQRTADALDRKARAGFITGGRTFGYDNVPTPAGKVRRINEAEAHVIRRIFTMAAAGRGVAGIAKRLNAEGALAPRPQQGRPAGWAPSSVRDVLRRPVYRGTFIYKQTRKRDAWGQKKPSARPTAEQISVTNDEWRIVPEDLWQAVEARRETTQATYLRGTGGRLHGRPATGVESKYLLPGLARCAQCNSTMIVKTYGHHGRHRHAVYACGAYHRRGSAVCPNHLETAMAATDRAVLAAITDIIAQPAVVTRALTLVLQRLREQASTGEAADQLTQAERARERVERDITRLTNAILAGGELPSIVEALQARERERRQNPAGDRLGATASGARPGRRGGPQRRVRGEVGGLGRPARPAHAAGPSGAQEVAPGTDRVHAKRPGVSFPRDRLGGAVAAQLDSGRNCGRPASGARSWGRHQTKFEV